MSCLGVGSCLNGAQPPQIARTFGLPGKIEVLRYLVSSFKKRKDVNDFFFT